MPNFLSAIGFVLFFLFSTYGFGCLITRFVYKTEKIGWAYSTTLGIAVWFIYGGVLNLFKIITPGVLYFSLFAGFASAVGILLYSAMGQIRTDKPVSKGDSSPSPGPWLNAENIFYYLLIISILIFCVYYLMPSRAFNFHDDFHSYFNRAVQLLAEGGFKANAFSQFGYNSLGGQDFMKAFPLLFFDVSYYNTFDSIICFVLGLALVIGFAQRNRASFGVTITAAIIYVFINPQIVNTSSVYSGTLIIMGLIIASFFQHQNIFIENSQNTKEIFKAITPTALFYASLAVLKANLIIYAVLFFLIKAFGELLFFKRRKLVLVSNAAVILTSSFFFMPWLLSPSTKYIDVSLNKLSSQGAATISNVQVEAVQHSVNKFYSFFSTGDLFWGSSWPDYLAIFFVLLLTIIINFFCLLKKTPDFTTGEALTINSASLTPILSLLIVMKMGHSAETVLRYHIPFLIAILPITIIFFAKCLPASSKPLLIQFSSALIGVTLVIVGMFAGSFIDRVERIVKQRHLISFPVGKNYYDFMKSSMSEARASQMQEAQSYVENGAEVLAWVSTPFHFDFKRNKIRLLEALSDKWLPYFPLDTKTETLWQFLRDQGFQYIIWEYAGPGVKGDNWYKRKTNVGNARKVFFIKSMNALANQTKLLYNKNSMVVIDISEFNKTK